MKLETIQRGTVRGTVGYTPQEVKAIAGWLADGFSATQIAVEISMARNAVVSRNAIIGVVHRNAELRKIGFARQKGGRKGGNPSHKAPFNPVRPQHPSPRSPSASASPRRGNLSSPTRGEEEPRTRQGSTPAEHLRPGNIHDKPEGRALDPGYSPPVPRIVEPAIDAVAYDRDALRLPLDALKPSACRFPVNDARQGETHLFCGAQRDGVRPYCRHHCQRAGAGYLAAETRSVKSVLRRSA